jgi:DNA-3-methyladenine glycosylase II
MATARKAPPSKTVPSKTATGAAKGSPGRVKSVAAPGASGNGAARPGAGHGKGTRGMINGARGAAPALAKPSRTNNSKTAAKGKASGQADEPVQEMREVGGELVRKTRAVTAQEETVPVQIGDLSPAATRPAYWARASADLVKRDRILKKLIPQFGPVHLINRGDAFVTLARSVVGQQISVKAAQAVWERVVAACPKLVPLQFVKLGHDKLVACGLSKRKAEYLLDLAQHFRSGALHVDAWASMDDEAVIAELTQIRGIGRWTAEMFLIFNLERPDILPLDDLGLIRAISLNYFSGEPVTRSEAREVAANWEPWRTVATWYMWRSLEPLAIDY